MWTAPSIAQFKARFIRDFKFAPENDQTNQAYVMDADITNAMNAANVSFNDGIGAEDGGLTEMYYQLVAFHLVEALRTADKGVAGQADFLINSKSVGGVSVSSQIPEAYMKDPYISQFTANRYGMQYLTLALPFLIGGVGLSQGTTTDA